jgi:DNA excision repair protein ERCC-2
MQTELNIAVRTLVTYALRSGDLALTFVGTARTTDAIRAHQKIQQARPRGYEAEVAVSHTVETDRFRLIISGRIDGVWHLDDQIVIDEIKTTTGDPDAFTEESHPIHWAQAKTYAYIFAATHHLERVGVQLTYYQLESGHVHETRQHYRFEELRGFFDAIVERYLIWAAVLDRHDRQRNLSIGALDFPHARFRRGQRSMAVAVYKTIQETGQLVVQAATGIGKTLAALFPAVKALGTGLTDKIFFLTARTTGKRVAEEGLDRLRSKGLRLKSLSLTAKEKVCFAPEAACTPDECEYARGHFDRINDALYAIFEQDALTREVIDAVARRFRVCPFEFALELSLWADVVICDYNYAFNPRVYLRRLFVETRSHYSFLVDEAHNLVDRSRDMFSAELRKQPGLDLRRILKDLAPGVYRRLGSINHHLVQLRKQCADAGGYLAQDQAPEHLCTPLQQFLRTAERWLSLNIKTSFRQDLLTYYFEVNHFLRVLAAYDGTYATVMIQEGKDLLVRLFCIDPAPQMSQALTRAAATIFFSGTLTPLNYFRDVLGCLPQARTVTLPSPFPPENLGVFVYTGVSTLYRNRERSKERVHDIIHAAVSQRQGNYLAFFPSYRYLQMVHALFQERSPLLDTAVQHPEMTEPERTAFVERFSRESPRTLLGFAVMGGVFGEGIDLTGDRLSGAIVVGVGLPGLSPERDLIRAHFDRTDQGGFDYAYRYPGINRVLQAAGRVIRSSRDRGMVLLIDERFGFSRYRNLLHRHWRITTARSPKAAVRLIEAFWR